MQDVVTEEFLSGLDKLLVEIQRGLTPSSQPVLVEGCTIARWDKDSISVVEVGAAPMRGRRVTFQLMAHWRGQKVWAAQMFETPTPFDRVNVQDRLDAAYDIYNKFTFTDGFLTSAKWQSCGLGIAIERETHGTLMEFQAIERAYTTDKGEQIFELHARGGWLGNPIRPWSGPFSLAICNPYAGVKR